MNKKVFYSIFGIICSVILIFQFVLNYQLRTQPPSKEWAKEVLISSGNVKCYPRILKQGNNYIVAHDDGDKIKIISVDNLGKKLSEKVIPAEDLLVNDLNFVSDGNNYYLNWLITKNGIKYIKNVTLDSKLNIIESHQEKDINEIAQVGDNILLCSYKDKLLVKNISTGKQNIINAKSPQYISGAIAPDGIIVTFSEVLGEFKYFTIKDDTVSDIKLAGKMMKGGADSFDNIAIASDGKYGYILVEVKQKGAFGKINSIMFNLDGSKYNIRQFKVGYLSYLFNPLAISSGSQARFLAGSERPFGKKEYQYDIIDFTLKAGEVDKYSFVSRTNASTMFPAIDSEMAVFCDYADQDLFDVYVTSQNAQFKEANNRTKNFEWAKVFSDTRQGIINTIAYLVVYGARWILIGLVLISLLSFFNFAFSKKTKLILFALSYAGTAAIKIYYIYSSCYINLPYMLPEALTSPLVGISITTAFSILAFAYGYNRYRSDLDAMPIGSFMIALLADTIMTQLLFIPFIII